MKNNISRCFSALLILLILFSLNGPLISSKKVTTYSNGIYLYTKPNYKGFEHHIGNYDVRQLPTSEYVTVPRRTYVNFDNAVSSIRLVGIKFIAVYTKPDFKGNCETLTGSIPNLKNTSVGNNSISSVKVNARCAPSGPTVTLYDQKDFRGKSVIIKGNVPDLGVSNFRNKTASIKLTHVNSIAVFNKTQYQGKCMTITRDTFTLAGTSIGLNAISSIKINTKCTSLMELTVQNKSGLLIQVHIPATDTRGKKEIASGQKKTYYIDHGRSITVIIKALQPIGDLVPLPEWKQVCNYNFRMDANQQITVKGSFFKKMNCQKEIDR